MPGHERPKSVGRKAPLSTDYADLRDPANGERVPRCTICGVPGVERDGDWYTPKEGNRFYRGTWSYVRLMIPDDRCEPCLRDSIAGMPANVDPLTLSDVA